MATPATNPSPPPPSPSSGTPPGGASPTAASILNTQTAPAPAIPAEQPQSTMPKVLVEDKRSGIGGIVDEVLNAVSGARSTQTYIDPDTGQRYVRNQTPTRGQQWLNVGREALMGAGAGLAAGKGAGNQYKGLEAGIQSEQGYQQKQQQAQQQNAEDDYARQRQARLDKANSQLLKQQLTAGEFALKRQQQTATDDEVKFSQDQEDREKTLGSRDLGVFGDHYSLADVQKTLPDFWKEHVTNNSVVAVPNIDPATGERQGVRLFLRQPGVNDQVVPPNEASIYRFVQPTKPGEPPHLEQVPVTGLHTRGELDAYSNAAYGQMQTWQAAQAKAAYQTAQTANENEGVKEKKSTEAKNYAEARTAGTAGGGAGGGGDIDAQAQLLVAGQLSPSQLSKRAATYGAILDRANQISMQQAGKPFDAETADSQYRAAQSFQKDVESGKIGNQVQSFNTFLAHADALSHAVNGLRNSGSPLINRPINWLKEHAAGNPQVTSFLTTQEAVQKEFETFLNNNNALTVDDRKAGERLLSENMSPAQLQAAIKEMASISNARLTQID
jgi:hypothetical protein